MSRSYSSNGPAQLPQERPYSSSGAVLGLRRKSNMAKPTVEQIRQRAQEIWIENHHPEGRDDEFWYQAEKELDEKELEDIAKEPPPTILPG
jgi:Protein of unknown function (DUF2934)